MSERLHHLDVDPLREIRAIHHLPVDRIGILSADNSIVKLMPCCVTMLAADKLGLARLRT